MNKKLVLLAMGLFTASCYAAEVSPADAFAQLLADAVADKGKPTEKQLVEAARAVYFTLTPTEQKDAQENVDEYAQVFGSKNPLVRFTAAIDKALAAEPVDVTKAATLIAQQYAAQDPIKTAVRKVVSN